MARRDVTELSEDHSTSDEIVERTGPETHPVPYPNTEERREYFKENSHPIPYPKNEKPYDDSY